MTNDLNDLLEAAIIILDDAVSGKNEHVTLDKNQIKSAELPKPCNGPAFANWTAYDVLSKVPEEAGELLKAWRNFKQKKAGIDSVGLEAMDVIVSVVSFLEKIGITHEERQKYLHLVNESNANRDNGKRFTE